MSRHSREEPLVHRCRDCHRFVHDPDEHDCPADTDADDEGGGEDTEPYR